MAHTNDLNDARDAAELLVDTVDEGDYKRVIAFAEVAKASALTDIAAALENLTPGSFKRSERSR